MEQETIELARIMMGEAMTCYNLSLVFIAIAHVYQRNQRFNGYYTGRVDLRAVWAAYQWRNTLDPTQGARFMFSSDDLKRSKAARRIARERGPPTLVIRCNPSAGAGWLLFYR